MVVLKEESKTEEVNSTEPIETQEVLASAEQRRHVQEPWWLSPLTDIILAFLSFVLAYFTRYQLQIIRPVLEFNQVAFPIYLPFAAVYVAWLMVNYAGSGLYRRSRARSFFEELAVIANGVTNATVLIMALSFMLQARSFSRLMLVYLAVINIVLLAAARIARRSIYAYLRSKHGIGVQRVLIVGFGDVGQAVLRTMMARKALGYQPIGYLDDNPQRGNIDLGRLRGLGRLDNLKATIQKHTVDLVVITLPWSYHSRIMQMVDTCRSQQIDVRVVPDVFQLNLRHVNIENLDGIPLLGIHRSPSVYGLRRILKRSLDLAIILLTSPVWLLVILISTIAIRIDGEGPIFYRADRVGKSGKPFKMFKFRTMIPDADKYREELVKEAKQDPRRPKIENDPRITPVGHYLRKLSIDELPNVFNVILGQMSLVGPRPPTPDEVVLYEHWHKQRLNSVPGITGLWQVSGRSNVPFDEMVLLDIYYIENWSIRLDIEILLRTIPRVLLRDGAY